MIRQLLIGASIAALVSCSAPSDLEHNLGVGMNTRSHSTSSGASPKPVPLRKIPYSPGASGEGSVEDFKPFNDEIPTVETAPLIDPVPQTQDKTPTENTLVQPSPFPESAPLVYPSNTPQTTPSRKCSKGSSWPFILSFGGLMTVLIGGSLYATRGSRQGNYQA